MKELMTKWLLTVAVLLFPLGVGCSKSINFPTRFLHQNTS